MSFFHETFRPVPKTGVIYVMSEARKRGWVADDPRWVNFGQGQPETSPLPEAPPRMNTVAFDTDDVEYGPVEGLPELRAAVADHYNTLYRQGKRSKYGPENVLISAGGRGALTRIAAALGEIHLGHFLPDYTAYSELLGSFRNFSSIPILLDPDRGYEFPADDLRREIQGRGLSAVLLSNPCNPTGKRLVGTALDQWVTAGRDLDCTLIFDEFYSHYLWGDNDPWPGLSAAAHVADVERDPVVIVNGLTKNWRYPGFRVAWTLGPRELIEKLASAGSFLDGGANRPLQKVAPTLLDPDHTQAEARALRAVFGRKRKLLLDGLTRIGVKVEAPPEGTFYVWGSVADLPEPISTGAGFFREAIGHRIITVPGIFFDVDPGSRRQGRPSRFERHVRFSFGPSEASLREGISRLSRMVTDVGARG